MPKRSVLEELTDQARPEMILGAAVLAVLGIGLAGYLYLLKPSLAVYRDVLADASGTSAKLDAGQQTLNPGVVAALERRIEQKRGQLYGETASVSRQEMEAHVIDTLNQMAVRHGVSLSGVTPGEPARVPLFEELPFDVKVVGTYFPLFEWFRDAESELRPLVIQGFSISPARGSEDLTMDLRLVAYRAGDER